MPANLKTGFTHLALIFSLAALLLLTLAFHFRPYVYAAYQTVAFKAGVNLNNISKPAYVTNIKSQSGNLTPQKQAVFLNKTVTNQPPLASGQTNILGESSADDNKWIEISLSEQRLYMKDHGNTVGSFLISSGKWAPTPTGNFRIWTKLRYARMTGGNPAWGTFYDLPNVPYTMYFNQGYGIHGAYWHNNFGHPMSHGCINMKPEESAIVYNWASVGTRVIVHN